MVRTLVSSELLRGRAAGEEVSTMDVSTQTRSGSWRDEIVADYETQQARLNWLLGEDEDPEEFL
ncbi:MAG TPA: hypothetical protein VKZ83_09910 [Phototrophicaceae bacterium]|nr:hypothetical protein [Phototrophicaceae bacterium]